MVYFIGRQSYFQQRKKGISKIVNSRRMERNVCFYCPSEVVFAILSFHSRISTINPTINPHTLFFTPQGTLRIINSQNVLFMGIYPQAYIGWI